MADGLVRDADGRISTDPGDFYAGGVLLPFAGHKGYGLSVLIEIVAGLLTGTGHRQHARLPPATSAPS